MRGKYGKTEFFIVLLLFALAAPAFAQATQGQTSVGGQTAMGGQSGDEATPTSLTGKITDLREITLKGSDVKDILVLFETPDGQRIAADLGPAETLKSASLAKGASASVQGAVIQIGGQPVFMASQLTLGDQTYPIERSLPPEQAQAAQQQSAGNQSQNQGSQAQLQSPAISQPRQFQFSGTIENLQDVDVRGASAKNRVALINTDRGKRILVDFGPVDSLQALNLKPGDRISVTGHGARSGDRSILFADQLQSGGQSLTISRPWMQRAQSSQGMQER
jgi:hypothetical protein